MIQAIMLIALGFLAASLLGVLLAPSLSSRAYRLARKRLEQSLPLTLSEIEAAQDQLKASYAVRLRRLEAALASAKQKAAMQLVDNSRLQMQIVALRDQIGDLDLKLSERRNAAAVLEQTITKRVPELDSEIVAMKAQLEERSYDLQHVTNQLIRREEDHAAAERAAASFQDELTRLRQVLDKTGGDRSGRRLRRASQWDLDDYRAEYDRLNLELSKLRQQLAQLQDRDNQQAGIIKGELQKLAELILVSAQPRIDTRQAERAEPAAKRVSGPELRRDRPTPWPQAQPTPGPAALEPSAQTEVLPPDPTPSEPAMPAERPTNSSQPAEEHAAIGSAALSSVLSFLPADTVLSSPPSGKDEDAASAAPRELLGGTQSALHRPVTAKAGPEPVSEASSPQAGQERDSAKPTQNGAAHKDGGAEPGRPNGPFANVENAPKESEKAFADARNLQSISELVAISAANGSHQDEPKDDVDSDHLLDGEPAKFGPELGEGSLAPQSRTLLDRLRSAADETAEAKK
jgi:hypothetical protein